MKHVTRTGRAIGKGSVTRAQHGVRKTARKQERPLPFALQCHPMAQTPTPVHPDCSTFKTWGGAYAYILNNANTGMIRGGFMLKRKPRKYGLYIQDVCVGYTDDIQFGLGWSRAARKFVEEKVYLIEE